MGAPGSAGKRLGALGSAWERLGAPGALGSAWDGLGRFWWQSYNSVDTLWSQMVPFWWQSYSSVDPLWRQMVRFWWQSYRSVEHFPTRSGEGLYLRFIPGGGQEGPSRAESPRVKGSYIVRKRSACADRETFWALDYRSHLARRKAFEVESAIPRKGSRFSLGFRV